MAERERVALGASGQPEQPLKPRATYAAVDSTNQYVALETTLESGALMLASQAAAVVRLDEVRTLRLVKRPERWRGGGACYQVAETDVLEPNKLYAWRGTLFLPDPALGNSDPSPPELRAVPVTLVGACSDHAVYRLIPTPTIGAGSAESSSPWYRWTVTDSASGAIVDGPTIGRVLQIVGAPDDKSAPLHIERTYTVKAQTIGPSGRVSEERSITVTLARTGTAEDGEWAFVSGLRVAVVVVLCLVGAAIAYVLGRAVVRGMHRRRR